MTNRAAVVATALVVGVALYGGLVFVEAQLTGSGDPVVPGEVVVANTTMHLDRVGRPTVVGELLNGRGTAIDEASITVTYVRQGTPIGTASGSTLVPRIDANEAVPFVIRLPNRTARPDDYSVVLEYETAASGPYAGLRVAEAELADRSQTRVIVTGRVVNTGDRTVEAHVVATFYDADGAVIGARAVRPTPGVLGPGEGAEFTVRYRTLGDLPSRAPDFSRYELDVYGEPVE